LLGSEMLTTRSEAMRREKELKSWKSPTRVRALFDFER